MTSVGNDERTLRVIRDLAAHNLPMMTDAELCAHLNITTAYAILKRLSNFGHIKVERFQHSRRVLHIESDKWTKMPRNTQPHWRDIPLNTIPRPAFSVVEKKDSSIACRIMATAVERKIPVSDFLAQLVIIGWMHRDANE